MLTFRRISRGIEWRVYRALGAQRLLANYMYRCEFNKSINWDDPQDLNQWINWLEFKSDVSSWPMLADKYRVRDYVKDRGFGDCLVPLLAKFSSANELNVSLLPPPICA